MKRTIFISLCLLFSLCSFAQKEKMVRIHKTDGTVIEYPVYSISHFDFEGKAVVNDDDYTQIKNLSLILEDTLININISAAFNGGPYASPSTYRKDWGILYSTSPNITIKNGTLIDLSKYQDIDSVKYGRTFIFGENVPFVGQNERQNVGSHSELDYNTTYYFRSYVRREANNGIYEEEYFYSKEKSTHTGNPPMKYYGVNATLPENVSKTGYIHPTEEAWAAFDKQHPYFSLSEWQGKEAIIKNWNEYLTPQRINALKSQCNVKHECIEGPLYIADNIGEDFCNYLLNSYGKEYTQSGYSEKLDESTNTTGTYVECDASWNVPGNGYWKYIAEDKKNPSIEIPLNKHMLANHYYKIEITLAPSTEPEETLPAKVTSRIQYKAGGGKGIVSKFETNANECSVITIDQLEAPTFTEASIHISSDMNTSTSSRNPDRNKFLPILRIAQIKITPYEMKD